MNPYTGMQMQHAPIGSTKERYGVELMADIIVPEQWGTSASENHREKNGAHKMMRAVLENALNDYQRYAVPKCRRDLRLHREAADWLFADDESWPCSAVNVCAHLGVDLSWLRTGLKNWLTLKQAQHPRPTVVEIVSAVPPKPAGGRPRSSTKRYTCQRRRMDGSQKYYHVYVVDNCTHTTYKIGSMISELEMKRIISRVTNAPMKWGPRLVADGKKMPKNTTAPAEEG